MGLRALLPPSTQCRPAVRPEARAACLSAVAAPAAAAGEDTRTDAGDAAAGRAGRADSRVGHRRHVAPTIHRATLPHDERARRGEPGGAGGRGLVKLPGGARRRDPRPARRRARRAGCDSARQRAGDGERSAARLGRAAPRAAPPHPIMASRRRTPTSSASTGPLARKYSTPMSSARWPTSASRPTAGSRSTTCGDPLRAPAGSHRSPTCRGQRSRHSLRIACPPQGEEDTDARPALRSRSPPAATRRRPALSRTWTASWSHLLLFGERDGPQEQPRRLYLSPVVRSGGNVAR